MAYFVPNSLLFASHREILLKEILIAWCTWMIHKIMQSSCSHVTSCLTWWATTSQNSFSDCISKLVQTFQYIRGSGNAWSVQKTTKVTSLTAGLGQNISQNFYVQSNRGKSARTNIPCHWLYHVCLIKMAKILICTETNELSVFFSVKGDLYCKPFISSVSSY